MPDRTLLANQANDELGLIHHCMQQV